MVSIPYVLRSWKTTVGPGNSYRWIPLQPCKSAHECGHCLSCNKSCLCMRPLGMMAFCVRISALLCKMRGVCPLKVLLIMLPFGFSRCWGLTALSVLWGRHWAIIVVHCLWLGLPRWWISKGQIYVQFSKARLFLLICRPRGKTYTGLLAFLFCFVLFLYNNLNALGNWMRTQGESWHWVKLHKLLSNHWSVSEKDSI